jgi:hypothetical protein
MDNDVLEAIRTNLTVPVWPTSGQALGFRTPGAAFAAARRGAIRTIEGMGRKKVVPAIWLRKVLCLEDPPHMPGGKRK